MQSSNHKTREWYNTIRFLIIDTTLDPQDRKKSIREVLFVAKNVVALKTALLNTHKASVDAKYLSIPDAFYKFNL